MARSVWKPHFTHNDWFSSISLPIKEISISCIFCKPIWCAHRTHVYQINVHACCWTGKIKKHENKGELKSWHVMCVVKVRVVFAVTVTMKNDNSRQAQQKSHTQTRRHASNNPTQNSLLPSLRSPRKLRLRNFSSSPAFHPFAPKVLLYQN